MKKLLVSTLLIIIWLIFFIIFKPKETKNTFEFVFDDKPGYISIYNTNPNKIEEIKEKINNTLTEYEILTDRYNSYREIKNLYYIRANKETSEYIEIDSRLYNMIKIGLLWKEKSNGILDIRYGNIIDVWNSYKDQTSVLPSNDEIFLAKQYTVLDVILNDNYQIKNNHPNLVLDDIKVGYIVDEIASLLEQEKILSYSIHLDNIIKVGKSYDGNPYKIGLESPNNKAEIIKVIELENKSVASIGSSKEFNTYKNNEYHKFIPMDTMLPTTKKEAFSITGDSALEVQILSYILYNQENKKETLKKFNNIQLITY